jgi:uncharacterized protein YyaL (SSP411 family)
MNQSNDNSQIRNRLGKEDSLYLRQHADNPVAWQPWDDEALALARETGRPILLSIGYSACHWCHVMAHESFEDAATAGVMNELYINIKVDREERPDLDKIFQLSHQLLTGRGGGWPLTLFLDPGQHIPFFAGTYFPLQPRYGMPSFKDVLVRARQWYDQNPDDVKAQSQRLQEAVESIQRPPDAGPAAEVGEDQINAVMEKAARDMLSRFDRKHGGFGGAPKFPQAPILELAQEIGRAAHPNSDAISESLNTTLEKMGASGLRDHLDGGFFRYCVDENWTIPHFEKMLYDNTQLLPLYAEAAASTGRQDFSQAAIGIVNWLRQAMLQENGAFSASIDADADGEEGGFHVWSSEEIGRLLPDGEYALFSRAYGLDAAPNFEGKAWHLTGRIESPDDPEALKKARRTLHAEREKRVHPTLDKKQITSWNALAASGLLRAARALNRPDWVELAHATLDFIRTQQWDGKRLLAVHNQGQARFAGYLDDYVFSIQALLESLRTEWRRADLDFALQLADSMLLRFEDADHGGFFFSDTDQPAPIARSVAVQDDATPAAYPIAIMVLHDLAALVGEPRYLDAAERAAARARPGIENSPLAFASAIRALLNQVNPQPQLMVAGRDTKQALTLKRWAESHFPVKCYFVGASGEDAVQGKAERPLPGILADMGMKCLPPVHTREELEPLLSCQS